MIHSLVRKNIRSLVPYSSARSLYQSGIFFDANENALGSTAAIPGYPDLNRYPDPYSRKLRKALGKFLGMSEKNIFAGNGSDEIIDLLIRIFVNSNESVVILEPTYGMYKVAAQTAGVHVRSCELDKSFQIDMKALSRVVSAKCKMIFCCSPNNPTGNTLRSKDVRALCKKFKGIVVVDEAYVEFATSPSMTGMVAELENLVVLRTFSKAWGLAGMRIGYAIASRKVIQYLDKVKAPYNLNRVSSQVAAKALRKENTMVWYRKIILKEKERMAARLKTMHVTVFSSEANFLLVKYPGMSGIVRKLAEEFGLIVRDFADKQRLKDCARISVATPNQNNRLLRTLGKML